MNKTRTGRIFSNALRLLGYQVVFGFICFMVMPAFLDMSTLPRLLLAGAIVALALLVVFADGMGQGERDMAMSRRLDKLEKKGTYTANEAENAQRYHRLNGVWAALISALPMLVISLCVALTAQPYTYAPQDLPSWMGGYLHRAEVGDALVYAQTVAEAATVSDYLRVVTRFMLFGYVGLAGTLSDAGSLLFDRLSPLIALIVPLMSAIGYQFGPWRYKKTQKAIDEAKSRPRKRLKKEARERQKRNQEKKQLI